MPSPFPGMDPYLEGSEWMSFHAQLIAEIARQLAPLIRPRYVARMEKRLVADDPFGSDAPSLELADQPAQSETYPDVGVIEAAATKSGIAQVLAVAPPPLEIETVVPETATQHSVAIHDVAGRRLVTAIELLSPSNKRGKGYRHYVRRRTRFLQSPVHLVEIDLLRAGRRVPMRRPLPASPYFAFVSRVGRRPITEVWPIAFDQPLPNIPVPLLPGDPAVPLALQDAFASVYDLLGYDLALRCDRPPEVPLKGTADAWARELTQTRQA